MTKNYLEEFKSKISEAENSGLFDERYKQLEFCEVMSELIREIIQNNFNVNTITALIQITAHKSKDENIIKHLDLLGLKDTSTYKKRILLCPKGLRGITGAGKAAINGNDLGPSKLEEIRQFLFKVSEATNSTEIKNIVNNFEKLNIPFFTEGVFSTILTYLKPEFCPISNSSTKEYFKKLGWDGDDYASLIDFTAPLLNSLSKKSYFLLDAATRSNVTEYIHGASMSQLPNVWIEKTKQSNRNGKPYPYPGFLTSPQAGSDGRNTYSLMKEVKPGDLVVHLIDNEILSGVSVVKGTLTPAGTDQFIELSDFTPLEKPLNRKEFLENKLYENRLLAILETDSTIFYNRKLELNQGSYLTHGHPELIRIYNKIYKQKTGMFLPKLNMFGDVLTMIVSNHEFDLSAVKLNRIYSGPPGTGKTHTVIEDALKVVLTEEERKKVDWNNRAEVIKHFEDFQIKGFIEMITFHQSYSYEEFIEGIRPTIDQQTKNVIYSVEDGVFKNFVNKSRRNQRVEGSSATQIIAIDKKRVFKVSLGDTTLEEEAEIYEECIRNGRIALGYGEGLDFKGCKDRQAVKALLKTKTHDIKDTDYNITSVHYIKNVLRKGDCVIVSDGNHFFRAIGIIKSDDYIFDDKVSFAQQREIEWISIFKDSLPADLILDGQFSQATIYRIDEDKLKMTALNELVSSNQQNRNSVFIIDEINRGNVSKIFGELLTLLEEDKRENGRNKTTLTLPYSKHSFVLPNNLYVFGTMNTTDRSIAVMDLALRRRFEFLEIMPSSMVLEDQFGINLKAVFNRINEKISLLIGRDYQIGHSYFMNENVRSITNFKNTWYKGVIPLLLEYFHDEPKKLKAVVGDFVTIETPSVGIKGFEFLTEGTLKINDEIRDDNEFIVAFNGLNV